MSLPIYQVGWIPLIGAGATTPVSIDAAATIVLPTASQRGLGGPMLCEVNLEGQNARWTTDGTIPTAAIGMLALSGSKITIYDELVIRSFRIIGVASGATITYQFYKADSRF